MSELVEKVADAVLADLTGRRGIRQEMEQIEDDDPEIWEEIRQAIGCAAILAILEAADEQERARHGQTLRDWIDAARTEMESPA